MFRLISHLSFTKKFLLIFTAFLAVVIFLLYSVESLLFQSINFSQQEIHGSNVLKALFIEIKPNLLKNKLSLIETQSVISKEQLDIKLEKQSYVKDIDSIIALIADKSNLTLDPDIDTYYLMDSATVKWPYILTTLNGVNLHFHSNDVLQGRVKTAQSYLDSIETNLNKVSAYNTSLKQIPELIDHVQKMKLYFLSLETQIADNKINMVELEKAMMYSFQELTQTSQIMHTLLQKRVNDLWQKATHIMIYSILCLLFATMISYVVYTQLRDSIHNLKLFADKINNNDLTAQVVVNGTDEIADASRAFESMVQHLKTLIGEINQKADITSAHTMNINQISHSVREGTLSQTDATTSVASAVEEIANSIAVIRDNTYTLEEETKETNELAQANEQELNSVITEVEQLKVGIGSTVEYVSKLQKEVGSIKSIIGLINGIASQTNLLALNAAIEAARAGEAGRGFSVVADEVRKLSEQTQKATSDISTVIKEINDEVEHAVQFIKKENEQVNHSVESIRHIITQTKEIAGHFDKVFIKVQEIKYGVNEQNIAMQDIAVKIEHISQSAEGNLQQVSQNEELTEKLAQEITELNELTHKFKT